MQNAAYCGELTCMEQAVEAVQASGRLPPKGVPQQLAQRLPGDVPVSPLQHAVVQVMLHTWTTTMAMGDPYAFR
jgi:hypothetical protein